MSQQDATPSLFVRDALADARFMLAATTHAERYVQSEKAKALTRIDAALAHLEAGSAAVQAVPAQQQTSDCARLEYVEGDDRTFLHVQMGHGKIEVGDAKHAGLPALWFGKDGQGLGFERDRNGPANPGETLVVFSFANVQGLEAIEFAVARVRASMTGAAPLPLPVAQAPQAVQSGNPPPERVYAWRIKTDAEPNPRAWLVDVSGGGLAGDDQLEFVVYTPAQALPAQAAGQPAPLTDAEIDRLCGPGRSNRWHNDGRQYDRDTARVVEAYLRERRAPSEGQAGEPTP